MDKYKLPAVDSLSNVGFKFEFSRLNDFKSYIKEFVDTNVKELIQLYYPDKLVYDGDKNIKERTIWADPAEIKDEFFDEKERELVEKIVRIEKGDIKLADYALLVHKKYRKNKGIILKALNRNLRTIYGATGHLHYRMGIWDLSFEKCVKECIYHKVLDSIIDMIKDEGLIRPAGLDARYLGYMKKKSEADEFRNNNPGKGYSIIAQSYYLQAERELMSLSDDVFSENKSLKKTASIVIRKAKAGVPIISHIENKEDTINYYLRLQSGGINVNRNNSKSNKGIQDRKKEAVLKIYVGNPNLTITQIIDNLPSGINVTRKTASKYIKEHNG